MIALDRNGLEVLDRTECMQLVASRAVGRVGLAVGALPTVLPTPFRLVGDWVYFYTSDGPKLSAATSCAVVAFAVDDIDEADPAGGWNVVITGVAHPVEDPEEIDRVERLGIPQWVPIRQTRLVKVSTDVVSGRRVSYELNSSGAVQ